MVLLGDVTGKGVDAAALTALVRHTAKTAARFDARPSAVLRPRRRDPARAVAHAGHARLRAAVDASASARRATAGVELAAGGHPLPLLVDRDGAVRSVGTEGLVLGAIEDGSWSDDRFVLAPGETLLFYTDGATDAPGEGERFGERAPRARRGRARRLRRRSSRASTPRSTAFRTLREGDDRALLAIQYAGSAVGAARRA